MIAWDEDRGVGWEGQERDYQGAGGNSSVMDMFILLVVVLVP